MISPACFIFMPVAAMVKVLPRADDVGQQRVAAAHAPPDRILLVRSQRDRLVHAGEVEVRAVEQPGPQVVVGVVVEPHQPLGAVGVGEDPGAGTSP